MNVYGIKPFNLVNNSYYQFFEVSVNDRFLFQEFANSLRNSTVDKKRLNAIYRYMDMISPSVFLPKEKFRQLEGMGSPLYYEFKKNDIRVYVLKQEPSVFILLGGYKGNQKADIKRIKSLFKDFNGGNNNE